MLNRRQVGRLVCGFILLHLTLAAGCAHQKVVAEDTQDPDAVQVEEIHNDAALQVDHPENFRMVTVEERPTFDELRVTGTVVPDVNRSVPVQSLAGGRAVDIRAKLGDTVTKGEVLVVIDSPEVSQAFSDYQKAQADEGFSRQQLARAQDLFNHGATAQQDLEAVENAEKKAQVDLRTTQQHISVLGADPQNPSPLISIRAPITGSIVEQNVTGGAGVRSMDNSPNLFTIANLSSVWVVCDVFENDLPRVRLGDSAQVQLNAYPERVFNGRVGNISTVLDPSLRTAKVRLELTNPGGLMRAGMFATATFHSHVAKLQPSVPSTAILRLHDKDWVFVPLDENHFRRLEVQAEPASSGGNQTILHGLSAGGKVIANALQFASAMGVE